MFSEQCHLCGKRLRDGSGPMVMDKAGRYFHFTCWTRTIDVSVQEQRERIAETRKKIAELRKRQRDRLAKRPGGAAAEPQG
jgi:ribosomal protein L24E